MAAKLGIKPERCILAITQGDRNGKMKVAKASEDATPGGGVNVPDVAQVRIGAPTVLRGKP